MLGHDACVGEWHGGRPPARKGWGEPPRAPEPINRWDSGSLSVRVLVVRRNYQFSEEIIDNQNEQPTRFAVTAEALLRAEDIIAAVHTQDPDQLTDRLVEAQANPDATVLALATLAWVAIKDAAAQRGETEEFMLRGITSWVGHVHATREEEETDG